MNITRLNELLSTVTDPAKRKPFIEVALAVELGYTFTLPTNKVDSVVVYFEQFHAQIAKDVINRLNEMYPFSVNVTYNMVVEIYRNRYVLCHEPKMLSVEDICTQLNRKSFIEAATPEHAYALNNSIGGLMRSDLAAYIRRFIV